MSQYYIDINLNIKPLNDDAIYNSPNYWSPISVTDINPELQEYFLSKGLVLLSGCYVYSNGYKAHPVHMDRNQLSDFVKIVWAYGDNIDYTWYWYNLKDPSILGDQFATFKTFNQDQVELIYSTKPTSRNYIAQVGIPHHVTNITGVRRAVTLGIYNAKTKQPISMDQAIDSLL